MPDELKTLLEWIESINKALILAVLTVILFLAAPRSDENLRQAQSELDALVTQEANVNAAIANVKSSLQSKLCTGLKSNEKDACPGDIPLEENDLRALGLSKVANVGGLLDALEGRARRCEPKIESEAMAGFRVHYGSADPFPVVKIRLYSSDDEGFAAACNATLAAARDNARAARAVPDKPAAPPHAVAQRAPAASGEAETAEVGGKTVTLASAQQRQLRAIAQSDREDSDYKTKLNRYESAVGLLKASTLALLDSSASLRRTAATHIGERSSKSPPFVVAAVEHGEAVPQDSFVIPIPCEPVFVLDEALTKPLRVQARPSTDGSTGPLLQSLRIGDEWARIREATPAEAKRILQEAIAKQKGHIEIFGLEVHEDLLGAGLPWLLALGLAFQLIHVLRLRELARRTDYSSHVAAAARALPTLPAPGNWLSGAVVYGSALVAVVLVFACHFSGRLAQIGGCVAAILLALTGLALSILPPRTPNAEASKKEY